MCKLCKQQEEDIFHVLLCCPLLAEVRGVEYKVLRDYVKTKWGPMSGVMSSPQKRVLSS